MATPLQTTNPAGSSPKHKTPRKRGKNYHQIHAKPLPLEVHPLPTFHPTNPISLLRMAYTWISHLLYPPSSHPPSRYVGYFSPETRSVHVTDPAHIQALWEMGFFGKGTLSRSEPSWLEREKARLRTEGLSGGRGKAAEDATNARREERRLFKLERARVERERIERQRLVERGELDPGEFGGEEIELTTEAGDSIEDEKFTAENQGEAVEALKSENLHVSTAQRTVSSTHEHVNGTADKIIVGNEVPKAVDSQQKLNGSINKADPENEDVGPVVDQEHLQLTLEEAFFLHYALGVLTIVPPRSDDSPPISPKSAPTALVTTQLLNLFSQHTTFPPSPSSDPGINPDDQFLLNYITYHHFRSLGWVVRPGAKFGADYMLYNRGPVFSHAEFAVIIIPAYTHRYWNTPGGRGQRRVAGKDWWWFHCVNRVQNQVKKSLVLCYVEVPSPFEVDFEGSVGRVLGGYRVREFVVRRWLVNRSRD